MMPEGPEVRRFANSLNAAIRGSCLNKIEILSGRYITHGPPSGFEDFHASLPARVVRAGAKGKLIYIRFDEGRASWFTLAMTGAFRTYPEKHSRIAFHFSAGRAVRKASRPEALPSDTHRTLYFSDIRNFGTVTFTNEPACLDNKLSQIGPCYLTQLTQQEFFKILSIQRSDLALASFLMDQKKASGIGNYLLSEIFYRCKLHPSTTVGNLTDKDHHLLYDTIRQTMNESYNSGGATLARAGSYMGFEGGTGKFRFQVYGKNLDPQGLPVSRVQGPHKRSIWFVEEVQKLRNTSQ